MKSLLFSSALIAVLFMILSCSQAPLVAQGTVLEYQAESKMLRLADENTPHNEYLISLAKADMGLQPVAGDIVRISYREKDGALIGIRVMNLSHQQELIKGGH
ncbi:MAG: hypothetical protein HRF51_10190 [bacterium]|jgi:P pilus assembly chaperone PapD